MKLQTFYAMKRHTFSINFQLSPSKARKDGTIPLMVSITLNGQRASCMIGRKLHPNEWDSKRQKAKGNSPQAQTLNEYLRQVRNKIHDKENELLERGYMVTAELLRDAYLEKIDSLQSKTLIQVCEEFLRDREQDSECGKISVNTYQNDERTFILIKHFLNDRYKRSDISLNELNVSFIDKFDTFLRATHKHKQNTAIKHLRVLKHVMNTAVGNQYIKSNPFQTYKTKQIAVEREFLTNDEIQRIINHNFKAKRLEYARDIFIFACYTGLSYIDVKTLEAKHFIQDDSGRMWIKKKREKTGVLFRVPLLPIPRLILEKYKNEPRLLPVRDISSTDEYLKEIAALCGIEKSVSFHTARYTFATTITLTNRISLEVVAKMMGHANTKMTSHYAKVIDNYIAEEMDKLEQIYG